MAAPGPTARATPGGLPLRDGFATMITFANDPDISLWEKATTPPGLDGGDPIDTTTFHNTARRTKWPRTLYEDTPGAMRCAYDAAVLDLIEAQINANQVITITFNDGTTIAYWGYLRTFQPDEVADGAQPEATVDFEITNMDNSFAEQGPVVGSVVGT